MLTLYVKTSCPYCKTVLDALHHMDVSYNVRNTADPEVYKELMELGGQSQAPFLYSKEDDVNMYESDRIVSYLHEHFG